MFTARRASIVLAASLAMVFAGGSSSLTAGGNSPAPVHDGEPAVHGDACPRAGAAALAATPGGGPGTYSGAGVQDGFCQVEVTAP